MKPKLAVGTIAPHITGRPQAIRDICNPRLYGLYQYKKKGKWKQTLDMCFYTHEKNMMENNSADEN